eukprot:GHVR01024854.1.p1 GENE.GHVR01024854.1~~GHVR01024854.1.p1  ORF type:complete len:152 (+),score=98.55 GHVR01024854.1:254-709(+)
MHYDPTVALRLRALIGLTSVAVCRSFGVKELDIVILKSLVVKTDVSDEFGTRKNEENLIGERLINGRGGRLVDSLGPKDRDFVLQELEKLNTPSTTEINTHTHTHTHTNTQECSHIKHTHTHTHTHTHPHTHTHTHTYPTDAIIWNAYSPK